VTRRLPRLPACELGLALLIGWLGGAASFALAGPGSGPASAEGARAEAGVGAEEQAPDAVAATLEETIVVTGTRGAHPRESGPVPTEVVDQAAFERAAAPTVAAALEHRTGIELAHTYRGSGARLQGLGSEHLLVLVDGERTIGRLDGVLDLSRFSRHEVEQVEVVRGPVSALYGSDGVAGVINIVTRSPDRAPRLQARAGLGGLGAADAGATASAATGESTWLLATGSWLRRDAFDLRPELPDTTGDAYEQHTLAAQLLHRRPSQWELRARARGVEREQRGIDLDRRGQAHPRWAERRDASLSGSAQGPLADNATLLLTVAGSRFDALAGLPGRLDSTREELLSASAVVDWWLRGHHLTFGLDALREEMAAERLAAGAASRYRGALFLQDQWAPFDEIPLTVVSGLRVDADQRFGSEVAPKLSLRWDPAPRLALWGSWGTGYRAPTFRELHLLFPMAGYVIEGNPELRPESSTGVQLGLRHQPASWATVSLNAFHNEVEDLIRVLPVAGEGPVSNRHRFTNIASARTRGVETALFLRSARGAALELGYAWVDGLDRRAGGRLEGVARHRATLAASLPVAPIQGELSLRASVAGQRPLSVRTPQGLVMETGDPEVLLELGARSRLTERLALDAGVRNLLDAGDPDHLRVEPRSFYAGISIHIPSRR
jgi:outer membrane receptor for ferrienterochelin and colicins